jgi:hypothetical protein
MRDAAGCLMLDPRFNLVSRIHNKVSAMTLVERAESLRVRCEEVVPAIMVVSKGLTRRYVPLAITLISEKCFSAFKALRASISEAGGCSKPSPRKDAEEVTT